MTESNESTAIRLSSVHLSALDNHAKLLGVGRSVAMRQLIETMRPLNQDEGEGATKGLKQRFVIRLSDAHLLALDNRARLLGVGRSVVMRQLIEMRPLG